jgi:hypothetical protein
MIWLAVAAIFFLAMLFLAWAFQERIAFQPPRGPYPAPGSIQRVDYTASDGQRLFAYVLAGNTAPPAGLLAFHGNADLAVNQIDWAREIVRRTGLTVVLAEYRGYMGLEGRPSYAGARLDAEAAFAFARDSLGIPARRFAFFGHSLGSAIAAELAMVHPPKALLLEAPFTSARDMAARMMGAWFTSTVWPVVSRLHFNTGEIVKSLDFPISVSHGGRDLVVPSYMGEAVYRQTKVKGEWLYIPEAGHNDLRIRGRESYWNWLTAGLGPLLSEK